MLKKPKLTILSILLIAMLAVAPLIVANDDILFPEGPLLTEFDLEPGMQIPEEDPNLYIYYPGDIEIIYPEEPFDVFLDLPYEDPMIFDDPMNFPGDDIPEMAPEDIPVFVPTEEPTTTIREQGLSLQITGTRMDDEINAGDRLMLKIYIRNNGKEKLDNLKIVLLNQELALRDSVGPMDLGRGAKASRSMVIDFPYDVEPGYYYMRINVHASGLSRVIYRDVYVA